MSDLVMSVQYFQTINGTGGDAFIDSIISLAREEAPSDRAARRRWRTAKTIVWLIDETATLASAIDPAAPHTTVAFACRAAQLGPLLSQYYDLYGNGEAKPSPSTETT